MAVRNRLNVQLRVFQLNVGARSLEHPTTKFLAVSVENSQLRKSRILSANYVDLNCCAGTRHQLRIPTVAAANYAIWNEMTAEREASACARAQ